MAVSKKPRTKAKKVDPVPAPAAPADEMSVEVSRQAREQGFLDDRGLVCPACGCRHFLVVETRATWGNRIRRLRECRSCGRRLSTYEGVR